MIVRHPQRRAVLFQPLLDPVDLFDGIQNCSATSYVLHGRKGHVGLTFELVEDRRETLKTLRNFHPLTARGLHHRAQSHVRLRERRLVPGSVLKNDRKDSDHFRALEDQLAGQPTPHSLPGCVHLCFRRTGVGACHLRCPESPSSGSRHRHGRVRACRVASLDCRRTHHCPLWDGEGDEPRAVRAHSSRTHDGRVLALRECD